MKEAALPRGAVSLLLAAAVFGVGGPTIGLYLLLRDPAWCSVLFAGCIKEAVLFGIGGWLLGLCAAAITLGMDGRKDIAWVLVSWNACGILLCVGLFFNIFHI